MVSRLRSLQTLALLIVILFGVITKIRVSKLQSRGRNPDTSCNTTQKRRSRLLEDTCRTLINSGELRVPTLESWRSQAWTVFVLEEQKALLCLVPKVASSSWRNKLLTARGVLSETHHHQGEAVQDILARHGIRNILHYRPPEASRILETYYKVLFSRHPLERLVSAYRSKMTLSEGVGGYYTRMASIIAHRMRNSTGRARRMRLPTFEEFAGYVAGESPGGYDLHWRRVADVCNPCGVRYDFIGRLDTLEEDASCVLRRMGLGGWFPRPARVRTSGADYRNLPADLLRRLRSIYKQDFELFGYSSE